MPPPDFGGVIVETPKTFQGEGTEERGASGIRLTQESGLGFLFAEAYASLGDAHRNIFHSLAG